MVNCISLKYAPKVQSFCIKSDTSSTPIRGWEWQHQHLLSYLDSHLAEQVAEEHTAGPADPCWNAELSYTSFV